MSSNTPASSTRTLAGRYRLGPTIGAGANAKVFDAVDLTDGSPVVAKILPAAFGGSGGFMRRFHADLQASAELSHPNIAAIKDFGVERVNNRSYPFVVTELLAGGSLRGILDRGRQLTPSQALVVALDVCRGLEYAHRRGLVHGAITPSNLLFGLDRRVRIADFGLSRLLGEVTWADPGRVDVHVAQYASPEQALGVPIEARSDVYSLCLTLIESVTGGVPFASDTTVTTLASRIDKLMPVSADLGALAAVLERAGRPRVDDRFTALEFGKALVAAAGNMPRPEAIPVVGIGLFGDVTGTLPLVDGPTEITGALARQESAVAEAPAPVPPAVRVPEPNVPPPIDDMDRPEPASLRLVEPEPVDEPTTPTFAVVPGEPTLVVDSTTAIEQSDLLAELGDVEDRLDTADDEASGDDASDVLVIDPVLAGVDADDPESFGDVGADWHAAAALRRATAVVESVEGDDDALNIDRRSLFAYVLVALGLVVAAVIGIIGYRALSTPSHAVPVLVGVSEAEARNQVAAFGWQIEVRRQRDDTQDQGDVIQTDPAAGESLKKGATLVMLVSDGPTLATLPEIANLPLDQARALLGEAGLSVREAKRVSDEVIPEGTIVSWSVPAQDGLTAGGQVPRGTTIEVVVSSGPSPREVPNVVNLTVEAAREALAAVGLELGTVTEEFSDDVPAGQIISSDPAAQTSVARTSPVNVVVSKGADLATVPQLRGLTKTEAEAALAAVGLALGSITGPVDGVVAGTDIAAGTQVPRGTKVSVVFGTA